MIPTRSSIDTSQNDPNMTNIRQGMDMNQVNNYLLNSY